MKNVLIFGGSGHAKVVIDILRKQGKYQIAGIVDHSLPKGSSFCGLTVLGTDQDLIPLARQGFLAGVIAIGDNFTRSRLAKSVLEIVPDFEFVTPIHPMTAIGERVSIGWGTVIMAGAVINSDTNIGEHSIINTGATIDHDNRLGDFVSVAPGAVTGGNVRLGDFSVLSMGARAIHGRTIGNGSIVGAGSLILKDIPDRVVAYGVPATVVRQRTLQDKYL